MKLLTYPTTTIESLPERTAGSPFAPSEPPSFGQDKPLFSGGDIDAFLQGRECRAYRKLGAHLCSVNGESGAYFAVWAPNAKLVQVIGDFNHWDKNGQAINLTPQSGVWHGFVPGVKEDARYKYHVISNCQNHAMDKADPFAFLSETPPRTASVVWDLKYDWGDGDWMAERRQAQRSRMPPSPSMKCIPAPGGACRSKATAR